MVLSFFYLLNVKTNERRRKRVVNEKKIAIQYQSNSFKFCIYLLNGKRLEKKVGWRLKKALSRRNRRNSMTCLVVNSFM